MSPDIFALTYLLSAVLFILGLKGLSHPSTARRGNVLAMIGMAVAIGITLLHPAVFDYTWILLGMAVGAAIGIPVALKISMTALPQLVALFHSFVGLAATLVAGGMFIEEQALGLLTNLAMVEMFMGAWIGAITFTGSIIAFGKLQGLISGRPLVFKGQHLLNLALFIAMVGFGIHFILYASLESFIILCLLASLLGVLLIVPIGGADMPVIVSMLNSYSGWAAAATGFMLENLLLVIAGALVGSSGAILSYIMCRAMNRSFFSVILGGFGGEQDTTPGATTGDKTVQEAGAEDAAYMMANAQRVVIIPGYGMAVAQAQHALREVMDLLEAQGVEAIFAIHPVAGRMPGHMNVLLAEADVPYDHVQEMDEVNHTFPNTDVVLVVGANDVVNPDAQTTPGSPLYGMPILEAYKARLVYVVKRSMRTGYSGVDNALFYRDNAQLVFGDAKDVCEKIATALKSL
jgi:NAD(P) transhydrogenase subunit beta